LIPVSEIVVPRTIGPSHEFSFAAAGEGAPAANNAATATAPNIRLIWHPSSLSVISASICVDLRWRSRGDQSCPARGGVDRGAIRSIPSRPAASEPAALRGRALASATTKTYRIAECSVNVMRGGEGAPLLFLHGAGGAGIWLPFMAALSERYEVIVPDHPGFGRSDKPDWLDELSDLAYFYLDFIEALGLDRIHLVGNSLGGWIAAELAVRSTQRLHTLTLIAAAGIHVNGVPKGDLFLWPPDSVPVTCSSTSASPRSVSPS
jgi:pimeloyl-ACP methyl ester carboxylesterase